MAHFPTHSRQTDIDASLKKVTVDRRERFDHENGSYEVIAKSLKFEISYLELY